jgi:hypothetical protein
VPDWVSVADLRHHLDLPADGGDEVRLTDAIEATVELIEDRTQEFDWAEDDVPRVVRQAALIQAGRLYKRQAAPFGVAAVNTVDGGSGTRLLARFDPDVEVLLDDHLREYGTL